MKNWKEGLEITDLNPKLKIQISKTSYTLNFDIKYLNLFWIWSFVLWILKTRSFGLVFLLLTQKEEN